VATSQLLDGDRQRHSERILGPVMVRCMFDNANPQHKHVERCRASCDQQNSTPSSQHTHLAAAEVQQHHAAVVLQRLGNV
jgi:hypothetical protein